MPDLNEDINDLGFREPFLEEEGCFNCLRQHTCELTPNSEECRFVGNRWEHRTPQEFKPLIEQYLRDKHYDARINGPDCNKIFIFLDEIWRYGEELLDSFVKNPPQPENVLIFQLAIRGLEDFNNHNPIDHNPLVIEFQILYDMYMYRPREMLKATDEVVLTLKQEEYRNKPVGVLIKNAEDTVLMRNLSKKHIEKLVTVSGVMKVRTEIITFDKVSAFQCTAATTEEGANGVCNRIANVVQKSEKTVYDPPQCPGHRNPSVWEYLPGRSEKGNIQYIKLQETNYDKKAREIVVRVKDFAITKCEVGDVLQVTGIWTGYPKEKRSEDESYLECKGIEKVEFVRQVHEISEERRAEILNIVRDPAYFENIREHFAPNVDGYQDAKMALFLQQIGSNDLIKAGGMKNRGTVHILFLGEPGTAKTELANYVFQVAPRCGKITGKRATVAGLTMSAQQMESEFGKNGWCIEGGALVMHDEGTLIIDELHQMPKDSQDCLNDPMEDMMCSGVMAGVEATFRTRTNVLALANPHYGYFVEENKSHLAEQFKISPPLFSRFDYVALTRADWADEKRTDRIMNLMIQENQDIERPLSKDDFKEIIVMAKGIDVKIPLDMVEVLKDYMKGVLKRIQRQIKDAQNEGVEKPRFTIRLLNSLRRFAMASARARLSPEVNEGDCENAYRVLMSWIDPLYNIAGKYDFSGYDSPEQRRLYGYDDVIRYLDELTKHGTKDFTKEELMYYVRNQGSTWEDFVVRFLNVAKDMGTIVENKRKYHLIL